MFWLNSSRFKNSWRAKWRAGPEREGAVPGRARPSSVPREAWRQEPCRRPQIAQIISPWGISWVCLTPASDRFPSQTAVPCAFLEKWVYIEQTEECKRKIYNRAKAAWMDWGSWSMLGTWCLQACALVWSHVIQVHTHIMTSFTSSAWEPCRHKVYCLSHKTDNASSQRPSRAVCALSSSLLVQKLGNSFQGQ